MRVEELRGPVLDCVCRIEQKLLSLLDHTSKSLLVWVCGDGRVFGLRLAGAGNGAVNKRDRVAGTVESVFGQRGAGRDRRSRG